MKSVVNKNYIYSRLSLREKCLIHWNFIRGQAVRSPLSYSFRWRNLGPLREATCQHVGSFPSLSQKRGNSHRRTWRRRIHRLHVAVGQSIGPGPDSWTVYDPHYDILSRSVPTSVLCLGFPFWNEISPFSSSSYHFGPNSFLKAF